MRKHPDYPGGSNIGGYPSSRAMPGTVKVPKAGDTTGIDRPLGDNVSQVGDEIPAKPTTR